ncbi:hypothetical protein [Pseudofrankia inefficax]|uniref:Uncharacterized protein n=1 Tax=Pseudofrankia inefficax (strain DSM 45817 / CECT 9037 / DDB 130130 / EuI1c) TaxID=298654 RepID=E3IX25_PSEI1|nr:hypothetical protein [Pseudofrankia inefficax]ADP83797.1 hypothetical protein FraEuI1c_5813 [Pseudofrankia inefficax]
MQVKIRANGRSVCGWCGDLIEVDALISKVPEEYQQGYRDWVHAETCYTPYLEMTSPQPGVDETPKI